MDNTSELQPNSTSGGGESASTDDKSWERFYSAVITFQICIICISITGNILVCTAILITDRLRKSIASYFLISLAISDVLTASFPMSCEVHSYLINLQWDLGAGACRFYTTMYLIAAPSSVINLLAVSIDRYRAISRPLLYIQNMNPTKALVAIFVIWTYVIAFALVPLMGWNDNGVVILRNENGENYCRFDINEHYSLLSSIINFLIPMFIMSVIYYHIYKIAHEHAKRIRRIGTNVSSSGRLGVEESALITEKKNMTRSIKAAKTISIIVSAFYLSWLPHTAYSIVGIFCKECIQGKFKLSVILLLIAYTNSAMNPFLYGFHNRDFREAFKRLLRFKRAF